MKNFILPIMAMFIYLSSNAQTTILQRDFLSNDLAQRDIDTTVTYEQKYRIKIFNINRKLFKVDGVKSETDFNITVPSIFASLKAPSFIRLSAPEVSKAQASPGEAVQEDSVSQIDMKVNANLDAIKTVANFYEQAQYYNNEAIDLLNDCENPMDTIMVKLYLKTKELLQSGPFPYSGNTGSIKTRLADIKSPLQKSLFKSLDVAEANLKNLEMNILSLISEVDKRFDQLIEEQVRNREANVEGLRDRKLTKEEKIELRRAISVGDSTIAALRAEKADRRYLVDFQTEFKKATDLVAEIRKFVKEGKSQLIYRNFNLVANEGNFTYLSEVLTAKKDETTLKITVTPNELLTCNKNEKVEYNLTANTKGGVKIDFSTNLFVNHGGEDFLGRTYYYKNLDSTSRKIVSADRGVRAMLSIGALVHIYKRTEDKVKVAFSAGASTTAEFTDLNFHLGPSLIIGKKDRLIISGGVTLKTSKMLDRNLKLDTTYLRKESPDEIPTVSVFPKFGLFVSVGYNISRFSSK